MRHDEIDSEVDNREVVGLGIHKLHPDVKDPVYGTKWAACFDIHAFLLPGTEVTMFQDDNTKYSVTIGEDKTLSIPGGHRCLVPTGLIFVIPWGYSVRVHARSGNAIKHGIILANSEGIIDADYVEEALQPIINTGSTPFVIHDGDRMCQAEILKDIKVSFAMVQERPVKRADRQGGFGSTGGFGTKK